MRSSPSASTNRAWGLARAQNARTACLAALKMRTEGEPALEVRAPRETSTRCGRSQPAVAFSW